MDLFDTDISFNSFIHLPSLATLSDLKVMLKTLLMHLLGLGLGLLCSDKRYLARLHWLPLKSSSVKVSSLHTRHLKADLHLFQMPHSSILPQHNTSLSKCGLTCGSKRITRGSVFDSPPVDPDPRLGGWGFKRHALFSFPIWPHQRAQCSLAYSCQHCLLVILHLRRPTHL